MPCSVPRSFKAAIRSEGLSAFSYSFQSWLVTNSRSRSCSLNSRSSFCSLRYSIRAATSFWRASLEPSEEA